MRRMLAVCAAGISSGCMPGDRGSDAIEGVVRTDSAGIDIVVNHAPRWQSGAGWRIDAEPVLQIGRSDGAEDELLHGIIAVRGAGDAVLVAQQTELRLYSEDGHFVRRLGGAGAGPGEFGWLNSALACDDRLLATDALHARLTLFSGDDAVRTMPLPPPSRQGQLATFALHACVADGGVLGTTSGVHAPAATPPSVQRQPLFVLRLHEGSARHDTLFALPGAEEYSGLLVPFGRTTMLAATDSLIYTVDTGRPELRLLGLDGVPRRLVRLEMPARLVTDGDIERIREQYLGGLPPAVLAEVQPRFDAVAIPATMPFFSALRVAGDGAVWLRAYQPFRAEEVTRWLLVSATGEWLGDVELPSRFTPHEFGAGDVLGVWRDEDDVEHVRRYRVRRSRS